MTAQHARDTAAEPAERDRGRTYLAPLGGQVWLTLYGQSGFECLSIPTGSLLRVDLLPLSVEPASVHAIPPPPPIPESVDLALAAESVLGTYRAHHAIMLGSPDWSERDRAAFAVLERALRRFWQRGKSPEA